jgi:hypothetical protein
VFNASNIPNTLNYVTTQKYGVIAIRQLAQEIIIFHLEMILLRFV